MEIAMQHNDSYSENTYGFVNNITRRRAELISRDSEALLQRRLMIMQGKIKLLKDSEPNLSGDDIREGLTAIVSVKIEDPQFEGQTKQKLGNSEARGAVNSILSTQLEIFSGNKIQALPKLRLKNQLWLSGQEKLQESKRSYEKKIGVGRNVFAGKTCRLFRQRSCKL